MFYSKPFRNVYDNPVEKKMYVTGFSRIYKDEAMTQLLMDIPFEATVPYDSIEDNSAAGLDAWATAQEALLLQKEDVVNYINSKIKAIQDGTYSTSPVE